MSSSFLDESGILNNIVPMELFLSVEIEIDLLVEKS